jgi:hypothetical protein
LIAALARPPLARIVRGPRVWIAMTAWCALALVFAEVARRRGAAHGADHVLVDTYGALVVPLLAYVLVGAAVASRSLRASTAPLVAFGAAPFRAAMATLAVVIVIGAASSAAIGAAVAFVAHGVSDPPRVRDALTSAYAGALGGSAYAAWFSLGASFGRRGGGRSLFLIGDWILGATTGAGALATPRAHLRNLLGGAPPMDLSERASAAALVGLTLACALLATRPSRRN